MKGDFIGTAFALATQRELFFKNSRVCKIKGGQQISADNLGPRHTENFAHFRIDIGDKSGAV